MSIGPTVLAQSAESYRKIRNSARFVLGNLRDSRLSEDKMMPYEKMPLVSPSWRESIRLM